VNAIIGGWQLTGLMTFISGDYPRFGNLIVNSNPCQNVPSGITLIRVHSAHCLEYLRAALQYKCTIGPQFF
jgi:hypothetical protein